MKTNSRLYTIGGWGCMFLFIVFLFLCSDFVRAEEDEGFPANVVGLWTTEELLLLDIEKGGTDYSNQQVEIWIDGWLTAALSVYIYEQVAYGEDQVRTLVTCFRYYTPSQYRELLLAMGDDKDLKDMRVTKALYFLIRSNCEAVLGPFNQEPLGDFT